MPTLERSFDVAATPETVFQVISDFERYPEFLPEIREARFDRQDDESARAHFDLFILLHVRYSLSLKLLSPNKISWELTDSNVLEANRGAWEIERTDTGSHVRYQVEISLKGSVPQGILDRLSGNHLDAMLARFEERILSFRPEDDATLVASS